SGTVGSASGIGVTSISGSGSTDGSTKVGGGEGGFEASAYIFPANSDVEPGGFDFFFIEVVFTADEDPRFFLGVTAPLVFTIVVIKLAA
ncbi:hypothetical protein TorRG33x02_296140, partial [Trema orientale]